MKKALIFLIAIIASVSMQAQPTTKTGFIGTFTYSGFSLGGTADVTGTLSAFNDQTNQYFANNIQVGDVAWDNQGQRWEVMVVNSSNISQANVDLRAINGQGGTPFGIGFVSRETPNIGLSLFPPDNNIGISQQLKSRLESHNALLIDEAISGAAADGNGIISALPDGHVDIVADGLLTIRDMPLGLGSYVSLRKVYWENFGEDLWEDIFGYPGIYGFVDSITVPDGDDEYTLIKAVGIPLEQGGPPILLESYHVEHIDDRTSDFIVYSDANSIRLFDRREEEFSITTERGNSIQVADEIAMEYSLLEYDVGLLENEKYGELVLSDKLVFVFTNYDAIQTDNTESIGRLDVNLDEFSVDGKRESNPGGTRIYEIKTSYEGLEVSGSIEDEELNQFSLFANHSNIAADGSHNVGGEDEEIYQFNVEPSSIFATGHSVSEESDHTYTFQVNDEGLIVNSTLILPVIEGEYEFTVTGNTASFSIESDVSSEVDVYEYEFRVGHNGLIMRAHNFETDFHYSFGFDEEDNAFWFEGGDDEANEYRYYFPNTIPEVLTDEYVMVFTSPGDDPLGIMGQWLSLSELGGDGNGIYGGSNDIPDGTIAAASGTFNLVSSNEQFSFNVSDELMAVFAADGLWVAQTGIFSTTGSGGYAYYPDFIGSPTTANAIDIGSYGTRIQGNVVEFRSQAGSNLYRLPISTPTSGQYLKYEGGADNQLVWATGSGDGNGIFDGDGTVPDLTQATLSGTFILKRTFSGSGRYIGYNSVTDAVITGIAIGTDNYNLPTGQLGEASAMWHIEDQFYHVIQKNAAQGHTQFYQYIDSTGSNIHFRRWSSDFEFDYTADNTFVFQNLTEFSVRKKTGDSGSAFDEYFGVDVADDVIRFPTYGSGRSFTGATGILGVDNAGVVQRVDPASLGGGDGDGIKDATTGWPGGTLTVDGGTNNLTLKKSNGTGLILNNAPVLGELDSLTATGTFIRVDPTNGTGWIEVRAPVTVMGHVSSTTAYVGIDNEHGKKSISIDSPGRINLNDPASGTAPSISLDEEDSFIELDPKAGNYLKIKNLPVYADHTAADADGSLTSDSVYQLTGDRTIYIKP